MKSAFSLLELIFVIVILGIIASFAIPKFVDTKDSALASTIKRDLNTTISSVQSYYLFNQRIDKISDAISLNSTNWTIEDLKLTDKNSCLTLEIKTPQSGSKYIDVIVDTAKTTKICKKIQDAGLVTVTFELY